MKRVAHYVARRRLSPTAREGRGDFRMLYRSSDALGISIRCMGGTGGYGGELY